MAAHYYLPAAYHGTFGSHNPVLRIADGDSVSTTTLDAAGTDAEGRTAAEGPNPLTGPFYIEGAEPGDTLTVHIDHLSPNRESGWSSTLIAPHVIDPFFKTALPEEGRAEWRIRTERQTAELITRIEGLEGFTVPLGPMLGCIGTAPPYGQAISSATSGTYGGNMDYRGCKPGTTLYFPVFVPGALLFIGDGHAAQGDGEVAGSGIETSFDVRFTAGLRKGRKIQWPRGENDEFIFTIGNARPLEQALQHATTEMLVRLQEEYGLDACAASTLLGMCARYDLGNIFDPAYTMVCKLSRRLLERNAAGAAKEA